MTRQGRPRTAPARPTTAGWFGLILFFFLAGIGAIGALATISLYSALATGLNPVTDMEDYELPEESIVFDRNGTELARFGEFKREVVEFEEIPPILLDATTAIEDKDFWINAGFEGIVRFLHRIWRIVHEQAGKPLVEAPSGPLARKVHETIARVTDDIARSPLDVSARTEREFVSSWQVLTGRGRLDVQAGRQ